MIPDWIAAKRIGAVWHNGQDWEPCALEQDGDGWRGETSSGAAVRVTAVEQEPPHGIGDAEICRIRAEIRPGADASAAGFQLIFSVDPGLACTWKPHLAPLEGMTIGDKSFRSPAIVLEDGERLCALVPDLDHLQRHRVIPHVMDYVLDDHTIRYGVSEYRVTGHVYYELAPTPRKVEGKLELHFYLVRWNKRDGAAKRDFRPVARLLWEWWGKRHLTMDEPPAQMLRSLRHYPQYAYEWAFDRWKDVCWQQFRLGGREVGGVVFIVTARQKPGFGREDIWREPKSLWNQAWFCSIRSAYGYRLAGERFGRNDWAEKAKFALEFALSAPQVNGLFPGYFKAGDDNRWESGRWFMSAPRRPEGHEDYVHLLDASWTCYWLLKWYRDIDRDERILPYVKAYVKTLLSLQREDGGFPAWVKPETLECSPFLSESPETSMHAMLLCLLQEIDPETEVVGRAERAVRFVLDRVAAEGRWEDFETYWSCSREWEGKRYGEKDRRSGLYNQCNFGIYWTAEALKDLHRLTGKAEWLDAGERILAELSLYQQIWQPPYVPVPALGGFGVMNSDDEWNDARQSLFALTYYDYYLLTNDETYLAQSMWAMRASFYMMYCPENEKVKSLYETAHPHFDARDYGFHMENFNHTDGTAVNGIGEFTIFDWGCGAAAASWVELTGRLEGAERSAKS
jgi:hypothetical protein